jgi:hypothetical protein
MTDCRWLPVLEPYNSDKIWEEYQEFIYSIFKNDFITTFPIFENKKVKIRYHPIEFGKEEAFFHVTCQDYLKDGERLPDLRRCERIRWVRKFIENYNCKDNCEPCTGVKVWNKPYKNSERTHILFEEEKYMVVVEKRERYCLLITAYYFDRAHTLDKKLKEYQQYK